MKIFKKWLNTSFVTCMYQHMFSTIETVFRLTLLHQKTSFLIIAVVQPELQSACISLGFGLKQF